MTRSNVPAFPTEGGEDKALDFLKSLAKATTGSIPVFGAFLGEIIDFCYIRPIEKRRNEWFEELEGAIRELTKKVDGLTAASLAQNDEFITVLHRATDVALRTHQSTKRRLLRNAIVSAGSPTPPSLDKQVFFLRLVNDLSINQILVLLLYCDPAGWFNRRGRKPNDFYTAARMEVLNQAYPEIVKDPDFKEVILAELERQGLLAALTGMVSGGSVYNPMTSKIGREFLEYVKAESVSDDQESIEEKS